ncbi:MAG: hypothetical protein A2504_07420 [Bdellovibrionales bacterium RIFOXYD12_FULL_39_22]|nr:MAG: hypothetical protein A2385_16790 [Bdellovibrionales bacterium RIFOXYB1_FULL_39_21]OFZ44707.1 MAG: hypothetical protein A2485_14650 [Bdellovibrionales bacterium RIFOXYC12_FULL_39_17]OFZ49337.1 MAG: hypothetical protein A2404_08945 [Bdellovibrionales bacterium RIFOXYC1_FULL_39_130]OFZ69169.1 MAG: hypothetical protein A2451_08720 [Bdellovibrionales bacterium RIFOXYC2_FULL_39_8]OFZ77073.1 MAG: hypothetical protein A2560_09910 [Bdellovibrionales bacterium RIFOXYD1_FULL_39_84]OFZ95333.1 MAG:
MKNFKKTIFLSLITIFIAYPAMAAKALVCTPDSDNNMLDKIILSKNMDQGFVGHLNVDILLKDGKELKTIMDAHTDISKWDKGIYRGGISANIGSQEIDGSTFLSIGNVEEGRAHFSITLKAQYMETYGIFPQKALVDFYTEGYCSFATIEE